MCLCARVELPPATGVRLRLRIRIDAAATNLRNRQERLCSFVLLVLCVVLRDDACQRCVSARVLSFRVSRQPLEGSLILRARGLRDCHCLRSSEFLPCRLLRTSSATPFTGRRQSGFASVSVLRRVQHHHVHCCDVCVRRVRSSRLQRASGLQFVWAAVMPATCTDCR